MQNTHTNVCKTKDIKAYMKKYYEENDYNTPIICEICNKKYQKWHKSRHFKSSHHQNCDNKIKLEIIQKEMEMLKENLINLVN